MFSPALFTSRLHPASRRPFERRMFNYRPATFANEQMDRVVENFFNNIFEPLNDLMSAENSTSFVPRMEVFSNEQVYEINVELAGVKPEDVQLEVRDGMLRLSGHKEQIKPDDKSDLHLSERSYGSFERALSLPDDAKIDEISASHKDGLLSISIPRQAPEQPQSRSIEIKTQD